MLRVAELRSHKIYKKYHVCFQGSQILWYKFVDVFPLGPCAVSAQMNNTVVEFMKGVSPKVELRGESHSNKGIPKPTVKGMRKKGPLRKIW